jgi:subtilisin family serine protease
MFPAEFLRLSARAHARSLIYAAAVLGGLLLSSCGGSDSPQGDPLSSQAWHLQNMGQAAFSARGGVAGVDLRVASLFDAGEVGDGVRVLVLDDGMEIGHPDLRDRIDADRLFNFDPAAASATDPTPPGDDSHGTAVAGIIAATANNGTGSRGVAPGARLGGARFICRYGDVATCGSPIDLLDAYGGAPFSRQADVINASFGSAGTSPQEFDPDATFFAVAIQRLATLRGGLGAVFVKAAGNEYVRGSGTKDADCTRANAAKVTCSNANIDPANTMPQILVVGAVNADGVKSSYSTAGSNVLVAGLGGEYGVTTNPAGINPRVTGPAIVTTDLAGCERGTAKTGTTSYSAFDNPVNTVAQSQNGNCDYMASMNGTSAATPTVSGVVALMLHANPRLTWRDVRHILARTARRVDPARVANTVALPSGESYVPEPAWTRNAAGLWFDNWYGFGLVDASAAVAAARNYTTYLSGAMRSADLLEFGDGCPSAPGCGTAIPVGTASGAAITLDNADATVGTVESVQLAVALGGANLGDLAIEVTSPGGTRSVLLNAYTQLLNTGANVTNFVLASNAFNGETGVGTWTVRVIDVGQRASPVPAGLLAAHLRVYGH